MKKINSKRILVIEDDLEFARHLRNCLPGAELIFVETLREAMNHLEANQYDMIIADLRLPDWQRSPEAMLTMIGMRSRGATVAAVTGKMENLPRHGCDAAAHKINLINADEVLAFLRDAERCASSESCFIRPVRALENFVALNQPTHAHA